MRKFKYQVHKKLNKMHLPVLGALSQQESLTGRSASLQAIAALVNPAPTSRTRGILHL